MALTKATGVVVPLEELLESPQGASGVSTLTGVSVQAYLDSLNAAISGSVEGDASGTNIAGVSVADWGVFVTGEQDYLDYGIQVSVDKTTNKIVLQWASYRASGPTFHVKFYVELLNTTISTVVSGPSVPAFSISPTFDFTDDNLNKYGTNGIYVDLNTPNLDVRNVTLNVDRLDDNTIVKLVIVEIDALTPYTPFISLGDRVVAKDVNLPATIYFTPDDISMSWDNVTGSNKPADFATVGATWGVDVFGSNRPADNATVNHVWAQTTQPTNGVVEGDIWVDTGDNNNFYVYDINFGWVSRRDTTASNALTIAVDAAAAVSSKSSIYYQTAAPTIGSFPDLQERDMWIDIDDKNELYMYSGGVWVLLGISNKKCSTYNTNYDPSVTEILYDGDLWFDLANDAIKRWRSDPGQWEVMIDTSGNVDVHAGEVTGNTGSLVIDPSAIANKTSISAKIDDNVLVEDSDDSLLKKTTLGSVTDGGYF